MISAAGRNPKKGRKSRSVRREETSHARGALMRRKEAVKGGEAGPVKGSTKKNSRDSCCRFVQKSVQRS